MKKIFALAMICVFACAVPVSAETLSLNVGSNGTVDINVDTSANVLGAAFTVEYDSSRLNEPSVDSPYFDTFTVQGFAQSNVDGFDSPLVSNNATGMVKIAAARVQPKASETTLFTLKFSSKEGASGDAFVRIVSTEMAGGVGGYTGGEMLDALIGVNGDTFPVLLASSMTDYDSDVIPTPLQEFLNGDFDGDGTLELPDVLQCYQVYIGNTPIENMKGTCDLNGNGTVELPDVLAVYRCYTGDAPCN